MGGRATITDLNFAEGDTIQQLTAGIMDNENLTYRQDGEDLIVTFINPLAGPLGELTIQNTTVYDLELAPDLWAV